MDVSLKLNICKALTLCDVKISTLVSPYLIPDSVTVGLGETDRLTRADVVGKTLDDCVQEKQRGL